MSLPSFLQRKKKKPADRRPPPGSAADDSGPVQAARTRARRRLVGAVVLLAIGIVGFPLIFETQPRPIALDIPIELPKKETPPVSAPPAPAPVVLPKASAPVLAELPPERAEAPPEPASPPPSPPVPPPAPASPAPTAATPTPAPVAQADDGVRAKSLLEGTAASQANAGAARFVVQVGAYTDAAALREARQKVEKIGLKTYTQVVETEAGKRTRVRVGPFATRAEADSAGAKLKSAGLPAAILAL